MLYEEEDHDICCLRLEVRCFKMKLRDAMTPFYTIP